MSARIPEALLASRWADRLVVAVDAVSSLGPALLALRGRVSGEEAGGGQLKTAVDRAAEGWVLGFLRASFPADAILAEEEYELTGAWAGADRYWTVDALDGTRSFVDGYDGFCCQVAWVEDGEPVVGAIAEPVTGACYVGVTGAGAYRLGADGAATRLSVDADRAPPRFVDSVPPGGALGRLFDGLGARHLECGSVGLKICRVAEGSAQVFAKEFRFKLWDVAPGEVVVREAGGALADWTGAPIRGRPTGYGRLLAAADAGRWTDALRAVAASRG